MNHFIGIIGLLVVCFLAWLVSSDRKIIRYRAITVLFLCQFLVALFLLHTTIGKNVVTQIAKGFAELLRFAGEGVKFVFGGLYETEKFVFFFNVLLPIIFMSALIGILRHFKILGLIIRTTGWLLSKVSGLGRLESYNGAASMLLGQSEVFISMKKQLAVLPASRLYTLCLSAMSTVSMSIVASYMNFIDPQYVVAAIVLNVLGSFIIAGLINPYHIDAQQDILEVDEGEKQTFFEVLIEYIIDGFKIGMLIGAMLIGFTALMYMLDSLFTAIFGTDFKTVIGYLFAPLAFLVGAPWDDAVKVGSLMATKLISNEFVAMQQLQTVIEDLSVRGRGIVSIYLVSFANFASIGIIAGAIKALDPRQGNVAAKFGFKLVYGATLVSFLSAGIIGLLI